VFVLTRPNLYRSYIFSLARAGAGRSDLQVRGEGRSPETFNRGKSDRSLSCRSRSTGDSAMDRLNCYVRLFKP
jgi:hypothetical protein